MQNYEFKVNIQAGTNTQAKRLLAALLDIKKAVSDDDLLLFAGAIKKNPKLVGRAKMFM